MNLPAKKPRARVAFVGMPNTGKSTLFGRLTGVRAKVANWPGMTVDLLAAKTLLGGQSVEMVDLPGLYSLHGFGEDERVGPPPRPAEADAEKRGRDAHGHRGDAGVVDGPGDVDLGHLHEPDHQEQGDGPRPGR